MQYEPLGWSPFWDDDYEKIAKRMIESGPLYPEANYTKSQAATIVRAIVPIYTDMVSKGTYPVIGSGSGTDAAMSRDIAELSGYPVDVVYMVVDSLGVLGRAGAIKPGLYNPALQSTEPSMFEKGLSTVWEKGIASPIEAGFNRLLIAGVVVGALYFVSKSFFGARYRAT